MAEYIFHKRSPKISFTGKDAVLMSFAAISNRKIQVIKGEVFRIHLKRTGLVYRRLPVELLKFSECVRMKAFTLNLYIALFIDIQRIREVFEEMSLNKQENLPGF